MDAWTRRRFLASSAGAFAAATAGGPRLGRSYRRAWSIQRTRAALAALGHRRLRQPDSLPFPALPAGADTIPQIEHIVVLMLENHSFDNFLGMLGRGDGFRLGRDGQPTATNPYADGRLQRAFRMPTTCQLHAKPSQEWRASHVQFDGGRNDGFVISDSGPVSMGYWTRDDLPFTYDLATKFPIGDRWFASVLAQTDPQRRYLIAATSSGMTDDIGTSPGNIVPDVNLAAPANGTIFDRFTTHGISWTDYTADYPLGTTANLYPLQGGVPAAVNHKPIDNFFADAAAGTLPSFSLLDPDYGNQSQENPQNIVVGESFLARVVHAIGSSPLWHKTLFILTYDEHGGYYDHVPPPVALAPDAIPPAVQPGESMYDGFARYGFRVPSVIVGPYPKGDHVTHPVYHHTSTLASLERQWNLPALTYRDANANDLTDFIDLSALTCGSPTFPELPPLAASGENAATLACLRSGPGTVPPPASVHRPAAHRRERKRKRKHRHHHRRHHHPRHHHREDPEFTG